MCVCFTNLLESILYFLYISVAKFRPKEIHKRISFYSKLVCCLSRLCGCNQYLLSGQQWHIIYLQETIPVFMYELNMPRRHRWRLHICNRSSRKDWHTAVNSIQTWLGPNWRMNAPSLWAGSGGGGAGEVLTGYRSSLSRPQSSKSMFLYLKGFWERGQTL